MKKHIKYTLIISSVILLLVSACNDNKNSQVYSKIWEEPTVLDTNYVVNGLENPNIKSKVKGFYYNYNLIIDTSDVCYFYQCEIKHKGCSSDDLDNKIPDLINLSPSQMVVIPNACLEEFLDANLMNTHLNKYKILSVSSPVDTIRQQSFKLIADYVKKKHGSVLCGIRLMSEEERNVLYCKKNNIDYHIENFK